MDAGEDTRTRIVEAAERLFAEGGEEATSLRAITRAAGANVAAVHYHFGGRDALLRIVLDRQIAPINGRRVELLDGATARYGDDVPVRVLLEAFLRPDLEALAALRRDNVRIARFMGRSYSQPSPAVAGIADEQFAAIGGRLVPLLHRALPHVPADVIDQRLRLVVALITSLFATAEPVGGADPLGSGDVEAQLSRLVDFCVAGLAARITDHHPEG